MVGVAILISVYHDGPAPLIAAMCRAIGLMKTINDMLRWDPSQCKISPGSRIEAMIINVLTNRRPLYKLEEFFKNIDVEKVFGPGIEAGDLNDDAMGRALDKLAEAGPKEVYCTVALRALRKGLA